MVTPFISKYGNWEKNTENYKKYFVAKEKVIIGAAGNSFRAYDLEQFKRLDLTTDLKVSNGDTMVKDVKKLMQWYRRDLKLDIDYIMFREDSPKNNLTHVHGLVRSNEIGCLTDIRYWPNENNVSEHWNTYHSATIIEMEQLWDNGMGKWIDYMAKHMGKEYPNSSKAGYRIMFSRGWLPENSNLARKLIYKDCSQACEKIEDIDFRKGRWGLASVMVKDWASGMNIDCLCVNERQFELKGQNIKYGGKNYDIEQFSYDIGVIKDLDLNKIKQD